MVTPILAFVALSHVGTGSALPLITKDIVYRTVDGQEMKADFYYPEKPLAEPVPFVVVIHGGAWIQGQRQDMSGVCEALAKEGFASATVSYRLSPKSKWPAHIEDVQAATRFFRANAAKYKIDEKNFGATGASAGGHLALLLGMTDSWEKNSKDFPEVSSSVKAVLNFFGPTDMTKDFNPGIAGLLCQQIMGKKYDPTDPDLVKLGPLNHITKMAPPTFTIQGDADTTVPPKQSERLNDALKAVGVESTLKVIPKMGHEFAMGNEAFTSALSEAMVFLKKHLGPVPKY